MTTADPSAANGVRRTFRLWRRARPFWGGLLAILSGAEIFATTQMSLNGMEIKLGLEGLQSYVIPLMLILAGVLAWVTPAQRQFYGVITVFVAVYSLIGVNFGGFFLGMLFGIVGGSLIFAWYPVSSAGDSDDDADTPDPGDADRPGRHAAPEATVDELLDGRAAVPAQRSDDEAEEDQPRRNHRLLALIVIPVVLAASGLVAVNSQDPAYAACTVPRRTTTAVPTTPAAPTTEAAPVPEVQAAAAEPTPAPTPTEPEPPATTPSPGPAATGKPRRTAKPAPSDCPRPSASKVNKARHLTAAADQLDVAVKASRMRGTKVTMVNLSFLGIVELPTATGTVTVLKFTMDSATTDDFTLRVYGRGGRDVVQSTDQLTVKENVVFYASRFQGNLLGSIPVDYTPSTPPPSTPLPLPLIYYTDPDIQLVLVESDVLTAKPMLSMKFVPAE